MLKAIRNLAITAVTACSFLGMPAAAGLNYEAIRQKLQSIDVTVETGNCDGDPTVAGVYNSLHNHLCISDEITDRQFYDEVIIHEIVHVIQDCVGGGIHSRDMGTIASWLHQGDYSEIRQMHYNLFRQVQQRYTREHIEQTIEALGDRGVLEIEAYAMETQPELVFEFLDHCN